MNAQQHKEAAESLLKQIPHDAGVLSEIEDLGSLQILALVAQTHAKLASLPNPVPRFVGGSSSGTFDGV